MRFITLWHPIAFSQQEGLLKQTGEQGRRFLFSGLHPFRVSIYWLHPFSKCHNFVVEPSPYDVCVNHQSCLTLCDPMHCSSPGSSVLARILEWVAISFTRGSSWPRDWTWVSCTAGGFFTTWSTREAHSSPIPLTILFKLKGQWLPYVASPGSSTMFHWICLILPYICK